MLERSSQRNKCRLNRDRTIGKRALLLTEMVLQDCVWILEDVSGQHRNNALAWADNTPSDQLAHPCHCRGRGWLTSNPAAIDLRFRLQNLVVCYGADHAIGELDRSPSSFVTHRISDADSSRDRLSRNRTEVAKSAAERSVERCCSRCLDDS